MQETRMHGWAACAAVLLLVVGLFNVLQGWLALMDWEHFMAAAPGEVLFMNFAAWGTILLIWGALMVVAGIAAFTGQTWARTAGTIVAAVNILFQLMFLAAFPLWALAMVAINVVVVYGLTAGMPVETAMTTSAYRAGQADAQGAPRETPTTMPSGGGAHERSDA